MKILFCTDGSLQAENAVRFGALIAAACQAETSVLGIAERLGQEDAMLQALRRAQEILEEHGLNAELITKTGRPVREIVNRTKETKYDLLVIGATRQGRRGPRSMSARAYRIVESVEPPVLVVIGAPLALRRILLCTGGQLEADAAVQFTAGIAHCLPAAVTLFHVAAEPPAIYADLIERQENVDHLLASHSALGRGLAHHKALLEKSGLTCDVQLRHGVVILELLKELKHTEYNLVVSGSAPARGPLREYVMDNLTREIVDRAELPVLVVRGKKPMTGRLRNFVGLLSGQKKTSRSSTT
jgi:nucleotide-binding universal stress UspA family protein